MGLPDMKLPIQYALGYPKRLPSDFPRFNFLNYPQLTFEQPDRETFRCLNIAFEAMRQGGNSPCVMNAANEIAVAKFLNICNLMQKHVAWHWTSLKNISPLSDLGHTTAPFFDHTFDL